jgi:hypothetical protein
MALATIRADTYSALRTLIDANKISGSTVVNSFPDSTPSFPCYILPMPEVNLDEPTMDGSTRQYRLEVPMEVYATRAQGQVKIAQMLDNLQATLEGNSIANLKFETLSSGGPPEKIEVNNDKLYGCGVVLNFTFTA